MRLPTTQVIVFNRAHQRIVPLAAFAALALGGCGGHAVSRPTAVLGVTERDFHISAPTEMPAGTVVLRVTNHGPERHELLLMHAPSSGRLPLRSDGLTVDEDALAKSKAGSVEDLPPTEAGDARVHLTPGRYILFCNMAGHYLGGMHATLVVR
jgi:hypothetical protein